MRIYRSKSGPFIEQPFYTNGDIETICIDELHKAGLFPSIPGPIRVDRFIEKRFKISPCYEDLSDGILGLIEFDIKGVRKIAISRSLAGENSTTSTRRINTTLAHESGHGLLHAHLFVLGEKPASLFREDTFPNQSKILCRGDSIQGIPGYRERRYDGRWWEHQANLVIGPLLLPTSLVRISLEPFLQKNGVLEAEILVQAHREDAIKLLSEVFDVNPIVARIRLDALFPPGSSQQLSL